MSHFEYKGIAVPANTVIQAMNALGVEGWRVIESRPIRVNGIAEEGPTAIVLVLLERKVKGQP